MIYSISIQACAEPHPNRALFEGVLTLIDTPSNMAPAGARGHKVILSSAAAKRALPSLIGMALDYAPSLAKHSLRSKVGVITQVEMLKKEIRIEGYLFSLHFPYAIEALKNAEHPLGLSYEIADAHVEDVTQSIWTIKETTFVGAAILRKDKAAYKDTWIKLKCA